LNEQGGGGGYAHKSFQDKGTDDVETPSEASAFREGGLRGKTGKEHGQRRGRGIQLQTLGTRKLLGGGGAEKGGVEEDGWDLSDHKE